ncbi:MAG: hypothetical protein IKP65_02945 [Alphaproteobacteria bacterium]|nr:hypothetical protein [Alphaproteobacteria bacterium]
METFAETIPVNFTITTLNKVSKDFLSKYFPDNSLSEEPLFEEGEYFHVVLEVNISREDFYKFLFDMTERKEGFTIVVESSVNHIHEDYSYVQGDDFITRKYVPEKYRNKSGLNLLLGIVFHLQEEKIKLIDLK